tara:strand:+ start:246 stop:860 length:615 start_codon:yes stop_codon:yes gene_type:complete
MSKEIPEGDTMADTKWAADAIERKNVKDLIPYDRNPNSHSNEHILQLVNSIQEWGFTIPILIDENQQILAGHGRLYAAQHLDLIDVPCIVAKGWSDTQKKAYVIADNKLSEGSEWDSSLYFSELKEINSEGFNLDLIGFDANISLDFEPNINPTTSYDDISSGDMSKAQDKMSANMNKLTGDRSAQGTEVVCPYCSEGFIFDGI